MNIFVNGVNVNSEGSGGDGLGDHLATQDLNLGGFNILGAGSISGNYISGDGNGIIALTGIIDNPTLGVNESLSSHLNTINKLHRAAASVPDNTYDVTREYIVGSILVNVINGNAYICVDNSTNAAIWKLLTFVV